MPYPDPYRPWIDPDTLLADTMALVQRHLADGDVAAVIVEPIQSDGGVIAPDVPRVEADADADGDAAPPKDQGPPPPQPS